MGLVFVDGMAAGHLLAAERGRDGERYILCDTHMSLRDLAHAVVREAGRGWVPPTLPLPLARAMAAGSERLSRVIRRPPLLSRGQLYFFTWNACPVAAKAEAELGWKRTPLAEGLRRTLDALEI
jgi:nucleoside-diphosphate-sugar epimerase